jgi:hypothetical protein
MDCSGSICPVAMMASMTVSERATATSTGTGPAAPRPPAPTGAARRSRVLGAATG